ncbi:MAG: alpha-glucan family phosphorylase [Candidatus Moraniibacteriota bacterium]
MKNKSKIKKLHVAYFSMEFAFNSNIPNYAGGLGVLAADIIHSMSDIGIKGAGISLIYHQSEDPNLQFPLENYFKKTGVQTEVFIQDRKVVLDIWKKIIKGEQINVPVYFLSTLNKENTVWDRKLTENLYPSDAYTKFCQELILGVGGVKALKAMGYETEIYHMNEGHSAPLIWQLLKENTSEETKDKCVFTTHTPVPAGHDYFEQKMIKDIHRNLKPAFFGEQKDKEKIGMTELALEFSRARNSVSEIHRKTCQKMFPDYHFFNVTNGVYHTRWAGAEIKKILNEVSQDWQKKPELLQNAAKIIDNEDLINAHQKEKRKLINWINSDLTSFPIENPQKEDLLNEDVLTIGFARRFVSYKRPELIFRDLKQLLEIGGGKLQLVFAGKCAPHDNFCNLTREEIGDFATLLRGEIKVAIIPDYDLDVAEKMIPGCDIWLNNPLPPREASGTSGMKAALNGVLNLSIADGWWAEAYQRSPESGWVFGKKEEDWLDNEEENFKHNQELLKQLKKAIDCYYQNPYQWTEMMKEAISLVAHFNTNRVVKEYNMKMWD